MTIECLDVEIRDRLELEQEEEWEFDWSRQFLHILSHFLYQQSCPTEKKISDISIWCK